MSNLYFGLGQVSLIPFGVTNPTAVPVALLTDISVTFKATTKTFAGSMQMDVDAVVSHYAIDFKAKTAQINGALLSSVLAGSTVATGSVRGIAGETATIPTTPFTVTVAQGATFKEDLGVLDLTTNKYMSRAATSTGAGVFSVNTTTGVYTFNTADSGHSVAISYSYTSTSGLTTTYLNQLAGTTNFFALAMYESVNGRNQGRRFSRVIIADLGIAWKATEYTMLDVSGVVVQDSASTKVLDDYTME